MILGIPAETTGRIIPAPRTQKTLYESEGEETFISLPVLFRKNAVPAPHGMVLKKNHIVLLTPRIETDLEIPQDDIHLLPALLGEKLSCFGGACFNKEKFILLLDTENLVKALPGSTL
jgi:hypothetical protein